MSNHTPGPWEANLDFDGAFVEGVDGQDIAQCFITSPATPEQQANARLIAAAPEMYATLKAMEVFFTQRAGEFSEVENRFIYNILAMTAKAEGK